MFDVASTARPALYAQPTHTLHLPKYNTIPAVYNPQSFHAEEGNADESLSTSLGEEEYKQYQAETPYVVATEDNDAETAHLLLSL